MRARSFAPIIIPAMAGTPPPPRIRDCHRSGMHRSSQAPGTMVTARPCAFHFSKPPSSTAAPSNPNARSIHHTRVARMILPAQQSTTREPSPDRTCVARADRDVGRSVDHCPEDAVVSLDAHDRVEQDDVACVHDGARLAGHAGAEQALRHADGDDPNPTSLESPARCTGSSLVPPVHETVLEIWLNCEDPRRSEGSRSLRRRKFSWDSTPHFAQIHVHFWEKTTDSGHFGRQSVCASPPSAFRSVLRRTLLALPVPHKCSLDFMKPLRYRGHHGDSESGRAPPAGRSFPTSQCARRSRVARYQKPRAGGRSRL